MHSFLLASSPLDLSTTAATIAGYVGPAAAAGLAILAALYGVRVIVRAFKETAGLGVQSEMDPEFQAEYEALGDLAGAIETEEDVHAWHELRAELFFDEHE